MPPRQIQSDNDAEIAGLPAANLVTSQTIHKCTKLLPTRPDERVLTRPVESVALKFVPGHQNPKLN